MDLKEELQRETKRDLVRDKEKVIAFPTAKHGASIPSPEAGDEDPLGPLPSQGLCPVGDTGDNPRGRRVPRDLHHRVSWKPLLWSKPEYGIFSVLLSHV